MTEEMDEQKKGKSLITTAIITTATTSTTTSTIIIIITITITITHSYPC